MGNATARKIVSCALCTTKARAARGKRRCTTAMSRRGKWPNIPGATTKCISTGPAWCRKVSRN